MVANETHPAACDETIAQELLSFLKMTEATDSPFVQHSCNNMKGSCCFLQYERKWPKSKFS